MRPDYYKAEVQVRVSGHAGKVSGELECFDLIDAVAGGDFYLGNALKYLFRAGRKPGAERREDLAKARTYLGIVMERDETKRPQAGALLHSPPTVQIRDVTG